MFLTKAREIERAQRLLNLNSDSTSDRQALKASTAKQKISKVAHGSDFLQIAFPAFKTALQFSGMSLLQQEKLRIRLVCEAALGLFLTLALGNFFVLIATMVVLAAEYMLVKQKGFRRAEVFEKDYTALLLSLSSSVKTGQDPLIALCASNRLFQKDSLVRKELEEMSQKLEIGASEELAINSFANTIDHPDIGLFRLAFILARKEGSSLADCLQRLAKVTRQRQSFRRKVKSAVAMQKLSANGIAACAIIIGIIQVTTNPHALQLALANPVGIKMLSAGVGLVVLGILWMRKMARSRI